MTTYVLEPATATTPLRVDVAAMLAAGELRAYRLRDNGTMRRLSLYPLGSTDREAAEWISDRVEMDGASVQAVARELHISTPTVRRFLESLELTEEIEAGEWNGIWTSYEADQAAPAMCDHSYEGYCQVCHPNGDPSAPKCTCAAEALGNSWHTPGCPLEDERRAVAGAQCEAEGTTAEELESDLEASIRAAQERKAALARNRALFTSTPQPTDEERAAALADARDAANINFAATLGSETTVAPATQAQVANREIHIVRKPRSH